MPPNNRLAPPVNNALTGYVPMPADPGLVSPVYSRFGPADYAQNLSIGVGEGLTSRLKSAKQAIQDPIQAVREAAASIRQMYDDPMLALQALRQLRQQVMSGPIGMGQAIGEMAPIGVRGIPQGSRITAADNLSDFPEEFLLQQKSKSIFGNTSVGQGGEDFENLVANPARQAVAQGNSVSASLKDGTSVSLVRFVDKDFGDERIIALDTKGNVIGDMGYTKQQGFHPSVFVDESVQRKGLATAMYDLAEKVGGKIPAYADPSAFRTPAGEAFRKTRESTRRAK